MNRLLRDLDQFRILSTTFETKLATLSSRISELRASINEQQAQLDAKLDETLEHKQMAERALVDVVGSSTCRTVNLIGDVGAVLRRHGRV